jgi:hypothetical protein
VSLFDKVIASGRWQVRYTGPDGVRRYAPHTFAERVTAAAFVVNLRRATETDALRLYFCCRPEESLSALPIDCPSLLAVGHA